MQNFPYNGYKKYNTPFVPNDVSERFVLQHDGEKKKKSEQEKEIMANSHIFDLSGVFLMRQHGKS